MRITIRKPDDFHCHFREGRTLLSVAPFTSCAFARAVAMGNTTPAKASGREARAYAGDIESAAGAVSFTALTTVMLTRRTTPEVVADAVANGVTVLKYIPLGVSTNSQESFPLEELPNFYPALETAQRLGMLFSCHWESKYDRTDAELPDLQRESAAMPFLSQLVSAFPKLRIVVEHATTREMIEFVKQAPHNVAATLTAHHALITYDEVCASDGSIKNPLLYCKPVAKYRADMEAMREAMVSGSKKFFFGSDSAPHPMAAKMKTPPAAGIFSAPVALPLLAQIFEEEKALGRLEAFVSEHGTDFYGLPRNIGTVTLVKEGWRVPEDYEGLPIFRGGQILHWKLAE